MMHIWKTIISPKGGNFSRLGRRQNIVMAVAANKTHVCYSFAKMLEEGRISEMKVDIQRTMSL
jgi:hypothetical protein